MVFSFFFFFGLLLLFFLDLSKNLIYIFSCLDMFSYIDHGLLRILFWFPQILLNKSTVKFSKVLQIEVRCFQAHKSPGQCKIFWYLKFVTIFLFSNTAWFNFIWDWAEQLSIVRIYNQQLDLCVIILTSDAGLFCFLEVPTAADNNRHR